MKVMALDYGSARTGVAVSDPTGVIARPLCVIERVRTDAGLEALVQLVGLLVVEPRLLHEIGQLGEVHAASRLSGRDERVESGLHVGFDRHPAIVIGRITFPPNSGGDGSRTRSPRG